MQSLESVPLKTLASAIDRVLGKVIVERLSNLQQYSLQEAGEKALPAGRAVFLTVITEIICIFFLFQPKVPHLVSKTSISTLFSFYTDMLYEDVTSR